MTSLSRSSKSEVRLQHDRVVVILDSGCCRLVYFIQRYAEAFHSRDANYSAQLHCGRARETTPEIISEDDSDAVHGPPPAMRLVVFLR